MHRLGTRTLSLRNHFHNRLQFQNVRGSGALIWLAIFWLAIADLSSAQTDPGNFSQVINLPQDQQTIGDTGEDTQVNVYDGANVDGYIQTQAGSELNIYGGLIKGGLIIHPDTAVNISGGSIALNFGSYQSNVKVSGGDFNGDFVADESTVLISGGVFNDRLKISLDSAAEISGGRFNGFFQIADGSTANISGGTIGKDSYFADDSTVNLFGGEFKFNGMAADSVSSVDDRNKNVFSGTLSDGSVFFFSGSKLDYLLGKISLNEIELAAPDLTPFVIDSSSNTPQGLRDGQSLTLKTDGNLGQNFRSIGATMNLQGGVIGEDLRTAFGEVNLSSGSIGDGGFSYGSQYNVTGGVLGQSFLAENGSTFNISSGKVGAFFSGSRTTMNLTGGEIDRRFELNVASLLNMGGSAVAQDITATGGSTVNITGGSVELLKIADHTVAHISGGTTEFLEIQNHSTAEITGGRIDGFFVGGTTTANFSGGSFGGNGNFYVGSDTDVTFHGGEFVLNGLAAGPTVRIDKENNDLFTATLSDGNVVILFGSDTTHIDSAKLNAVALPAADTTPIFVDELSTTPINGIRAGQTLNVQSGGIVTNTFAAVDGTINVNGGQLDGLRTAYSTVNLNQGSVGNIESYRGSILNLQGGRVTGLLNARETKIEIGRSLTNPSLPGSRVTSLRTADDTVVNVNIGGLVNKLDLRPNGTLNLNGGGIGSDVQLYQQTNFNMTGGSVGARLASAGKVEMTGGTIGLDASFVGDAVVNISGGMILEGVRLDNDAIVNISGGRIRSDLTAVRASTINISGGTVGSGMRIFSNANVSGGVVGDSFRADERSKVKISGGLIGKNFAAADQSQVEISGGKFGSGFTTAPNSNVTLFGNDFVQGTNFRAGTLADGSSFILALRRGDRISTINLSEVNLTPPDVTPIIIDATSTESPNSLRNGQTLIVQEGGVLASPSNVIPFTNFKGTLNIDGGRAGDVETAYGVVNMTAGSVDKLDAYEGGVYNISGGTVLGQFRLFDESTANLSGGTLAGGLFASQTSTTNIFGSNFTLNGQAIEDLVVFSQFEILQRDGSVLAGTFASGESFSFAVKSLTVGGFFFSPDARLTVTQIGTAVPEPTAFLLLGFGGLAIAAKRQRRNNGQRCGSA